MSCRRDYLAALNLLFQREPGDRMLSPHEIATLMLIKDAPCRIEPGRAELHSLLNLELAVMESSATGFVHPRVTPRGETILQAIARLF